MTETMPFDDIRELIAKMPEADQVAADGVRQILNDFPGPGPVLGRLEADLEWLASWQKKSLPAISQPLIAVFAGTHGVAGAIMDGDLIKIARRRVDGLTKDKAAVRGIAVNMNAAFKVYEMGVEHAVSDFRQGPTLSERECAASIAFGMEVVAEGADIIALGNAGTGSATAAAAIALALYGGTADYWAGAHNHQAKGRIKAVEEAVRAYDLPSTDPLHYLRNYGGRDIAGMVGAIIAARIQSIPVILDGFVVCAAAAILHAIDPRAIDHCRAGTLTCEPAHEALLDRMGLSPSFDFGVSLGDGTGAALAMQVLQAAAKGLETLQD